MSRVTITFHIDIPDGIVPDVDYSEAPEELVEMVGSTVVRSQPATVDSDARVAAGPFPPMVAMQPPSAPLCSTHGTAMVRYPAGVNAKTNKPYNASWRCAVRDCPTKPLWDRDAA